MMGFSATFCRRPSGPMVLPMQIQGDFSENAHTYAHPRPGLYKRIHITPAYTWDLSIEADAISELARSLTYRVYPHSPSATPVFQGIPCPSAIDDDGGLSFSDMFETHKANVSTLDTMLTREPRQFLYIANTLFGQSPLDNVQFWDCAFLIHKFALTYFNGGTQSPDLTGAWNRLIDAGLCDTLVLLLRHLRILVTHYI